MRIEHSRKAVLLNANGNAGLDAVPGVHGHMLDHDGTDGAQASAAQRGADGENLQLKLYTNKNKNLVHLAAPDLLEEHYRLAQVPTIRWSSRGGKGGNGGRGGDGGSGKEGMPGNDAEAANTPGTDGQNGGNAGNGGEGSNGANGGNGGNVKITVTRKDSYLLMLLDPCEESAAKACLEGGAKGLRGEHGRGGEGGFGGKGGAALMDGKKELAPGGKPGRDGANGLSPLWDLEDGNAGFPGSFQIIVTEDDGGEVFYSGRYELQFQNLEMAGTSPMEEAHEIEFGDIVTVRDIEIRNIGRMPLPDEQKVLLQIRDTGQPNINPFYPDCFIPEGTSMPPDFTTTSVGELRFFASYPVEVRDEDDFDPVKQSTFFKLQAFQAGPTKPREEFSAFQREYVKFHPGDGIPVSFRFPVENTDGMTGVESLHPGEATIVSFTFKNVGRSTFGGFHLDGDENEKKNRRLAVRYSLSSNHPYDVTGDQAQFTAVLTSSNKETTGEVVDLSGRGRMLDIDSLGPGESVDFITKFAFQRDVPIYSRAGLCVDILLEMLPLPVGVEFAANDEERERSVPFMSVCQRRKIEIVCEPKYETVEDAKVVLVTSSTTKQFQFRSWTQTVFKEKLHILYEVYSISRYASIDPDFELENGMTVKEAFKGKLVVLLTDLFKPIQREDLEVSPIHLLDHGCMEQTSGFDSSTRWLVVGAQENSDLELLEEHLSELSTEGESFPDIASFEKSIQEVVSERKAVGRQSDPLPIREDTVTVTLPSGEEQGSKKLKKIAESLADWLKQNDPLCQYAIEYDESDREEKKGFIKRSSSEIKVRRGFCRSQNSVIVVKGQEANDPNLIESDAMLLSVAEAMPKDMRVSLFCEAIRKSLSTPVLTAYKFALVSDLIRDESTFLDCKMKMNDDLELSFPSIGILLESVEVLQLIRDCKSDDELQSRTISEFSDLMARFELVANSKDLRPRFSIVGRGKKKTTHEAMSDIVERLANQLKPILDRDAIERQKKVLKEETKNFLKADLVGSKVVNVRADGRWIQGLNYLHSTENDTIFGADALPSTRLIEMDVDIDEEAEDYKVPSPSVRVYSSAEIQKILDEQNARKVKSGELAEKQKHQREVMIV